MYSDWLKSYLGVAELLNDDILEAKDYLVDYITNNKEVDLERVAMV